MTVGGGGTAGGSADSHAVRYRPDVDGLRAIAVLAVIFFHLSTSTIAGGFLGVDMFFVLSGFLITSIIWREAQLGQYSIARFYERRIRRILPALLLVLFVTTVVSAMVLLPADLIGYSKSLIATMAFVANFYFWRDTTNYFARASDYKPLLHMWSLGVEEQFYIFFPLLLAFLARYRVRVALYVTAALTVVSFVANMFMNYVGGSSPAFYLLPTRAWELGIGAVIALLPAYYTLRRSGGLLTGIGILLVIAGIFRPYYVPFFLPAGTPVVAGTALLVFAGRSESPFVTRALSWRPVVFIGLISYSLYLWHWPVFVLLRYYFVDGVPPLVMAAGLVFIAGMSILSWYFVERPFRSRRMPIRSVVFRTCSSMAALAVIAVAIVAFHGLPTRFNRQSAIINAAIGTEYRCEIGQMLPLGISRACPLNLPSRNPADADVVLLGNSHAQMYAPEWEKIFREHRVQGLLVPLNACLPTVEANINKECNGAALRNLQSVLSLPHVRTVIVALTWYHATLTDTSGHVMQNGDNKPLVAAIDDLDQRLRNAGKRVILVGPIILPGWDVPTTISRQLAYGVPVAQKLYVPEAAFEQRFGPMIRHFESENDTAFAPAFRVQCMLNRCYYVLDGHSLYADDNHISQYELWRFRPMFETAYTQALRSTASSR